jgi:hypothetical protein
LASGGGTSEVGPYVITFGTRQRAGRGYLKMTISLPKLNAQAQLDASLV